MSLPCFASADQVHEMEDLLANHDDQGYLDLMNATPRFESGSSVHVIKYDAWGELFELRVLSTDTTCYTPDRSDLKITNLENHLGD
jgi:hypothetical protein